MRFAAAVAPFVVLLSFDCALAVQLSDCTAFIYRKAFRLFVDIPIIPVPSAECWEEQNVAR